MRMHSVDSTFRRKAQHGCCQRNSPTLLHWTIVARWLVSLAAVPMRVLMAASTPPGRRAFSMSWRAFGRRCWVVVWAAHSCVRVSPGSSPSIVHAICAQRSRRTMPLRAMSWRRWASLRLGVLSVPSSATAAFSTICSMSARLWRRLREAALIDLICPCRAGTSPAGR